MSKYEPLAAYLSSYPDGEVALTFEEIEAILGLPLPRAAYTHRAWWSNNGSNNVMTRAWLSAGFRSERVDMTARRLVFRRGDAPAAASALSGERTKAAPGRTLERLWTALAGTVRTPEGIDLVDPVGDAWDRAA